MPSVCIIFKLQIYLIWGWRLDSKDYEEYVPKYPADSDRNSMSPDLIMVTQKQKLPRVFLY